MHAPFFGNLAIFDFLPCCTGEVLICFGQLLWRSNNGIFRATFGSRWLYSFGSKSVPSRVLCTTVLDYECKSSRLLNLRPKQIRTCIQYGSPILTCNLSIRSYFHSWSCTLFHFNPQHCWSWVTTIMLNLAYTSTGLLSPFLSLCASRPLFQHQYILHGPSVLVICCWQCIQPSIANMAMSSKRTNARTSMYMYMEL